VNRTTQPARRAAKVGEARGSALILAPRRDLPPPLDSGDVSSGPYPMGSKTTGTKHVPDESKVGIESQWSYNDFTRV